MSTPDIEGIKTLAPEAIFSIGEASKLLGMSHNGVLARVKKGQIKAGKVGARYYISGSEIQKQMTLPTGYDI